MTGPYILISIVVGIPILASVGFFIWHWLNNRKIVRLTYIKEGAKKVTWVENRSVAAFRSAIEANPEEYDAKSLTIEIEDRNKSNLFGLDGEIRTISWVEPGPHY